MGSKKFGRYSAVALPHLEESIVRNEAVFERLSDELVKRVPQGGRLLVFGSGHSSILAFEVYHRAGGPSFVIPVVADFLLPTAGPPVVRRLERTPGLVEPILARAEPQANDMIWIFSQSGINPSTIDLALEAKKRGLFVVAWSSLKHSQSVASRHPTKKKLYEVADATVDLGGEAGDAAVKISPTVAAGPLSTLTAVFLAHSLLVEAGAALEAQGHRVFYTSVNMPGGEERNRDLEREAATRDPLLRE